MEKPNPTAIRAKAPTACDVCRQRKLRCDGQTPSCSNCTLYKAACNYAKTRNKPGPRKGWKRKSSDSHVQDAPTRPSKRPTTSGEVGRDSTPRTAGSSSPRATASSSSTGSLSLDRQSPSTSSTTPKSSFARSEGICQYSGACTESHSTVQSPSTGWIGVTTQTGQDPTISYAFADQDLINSFHALDGHAGHSFNGSPHANLHTLSLDLNILPSLDMGFHQGPIEACLGTEDVGILAPLHPTSPSYPIALRYIHTFLPILPLSEAADLVASCTGRSDSINATFFLHALDALMNVVSPPSHPPAIDYYHMAQSQSMTAYLSAVSSRFIHEDDSLGAHFLTVSGLMYLMLYQVFTSGWTSSASAFLQLAIDIVEEMPHGTPLQLGRKRWLSRLAWLYGKALEGGGAVAPPLQHMHVRPASPQPAAHREMAQVRETAPLAALTLDEDMHAFDSLVELCLDLETIIQVTKEKDPAWFNNLTLPLCQRVNEWIKKNPWAHAALLQLTVDDNAAETDDQKVRDAASRVLHLINYGMSLKFETMDRLCSIKKTSFFVAVTRIIDAADYLVTSGRIWLWAFIEPALTISRELLTYKAVNCSQDNKRTHASGEKMMLALIKDVYNAALEVIPPTAPRRAAIAHAVESISLVIQSEAETARM
ncbi:hypothetical protein EIP91_004517 [Steccherinum ochraceum]|uniref:Zn(2)-C6 fungal-type domain-containing protein n=1 Tax=Steccherinum ochraceum TaxID=92696 RepID=A0A4R0REV7_9APHY|nr:hypothetical protein EIP91_004517 [Steccherinum ochraceum]